MSFLTSLRASSRRVAPMSYTIPGVSTLHTSAARFSLKESDKSEYQSQFHPRPKPLVCHSAHTCSPRSTIERVSFMQFISDMPNPSRSRPGRPGQPLRGQEGAAIEGSESRQGELELRCCQQQRGTGSFGSLLCASIGILEILIINHLLSSSVRNRSRQTGVNSMPLKSPSRNYSRRPRTFLSRNKHSLFPPIPFRERRVVTLKMHALPFSFLFR